LTAGALEGVQKVLYFLFTIHVLTCIFLILVVLLQRGKGADLSVFGGGTTQTAFGARGAATLLHKLTVGFFVAFLVTTVSIALVEAGSGSQSVLSGVEGEAPAAAATDQAPADQPAEAAEAPATDGSEEALSPEAPESAAPAPAASVPAEAEAPSESAKQ
jgi:preprotein translocase subunit SecG